MSYFLKEIKLPHSYLTQYFNACSNVNDRYIYLKMKGGRVCERYLVLVTLSLIIATNRKDELSFDTILTK